MINKANIEKTNAWPFVEAKRILIQRKKNIDQKGKIVLQTADDISVVSNTASSADVVLSILFDA